MAESRAKEARDGCWRGKGDSSPFVPGLPVEVPRGGSLRLLFQEMECCTRCDLALERTQVVLGKGPADARLMFIGEAPGAEEDRRGEPFVGASGRLIDRLLEASGLERKEVFITNIVACRPPKNRTPRVGEVRAHAPWLEAQLRLVAPELIVTLGRVALTYFVPGAKITEIRGEVQRVERDGRELVILPTLHPAAALRRRELLPSLEADFARIGALLAGG